MSDRINALVGPAVLAPPAEFVPCGLCGQPTMMTGTKRCDRCWELETRIEANPSLSWVILARIEVANTQTDEAIGDIAMAAARTARKLQ